MNKTTSPSLFVLDSRALTDFHDRVLQGGRLDPEHADSELWRWVDENHRCNAALWAEEDKARRSDVPDSEIARCKRAIDRTNQRRNDAAEAIDRRLLAALDQRPLKQDARLASETAGAMIDRLSILALKIHHMRIQTLREDADEDHRRRCREKLAVLIEQRRDLAGCLDRLLWEASCGTSRFKIYRQFKMYNDPTLNPELYRRRVADVTAASSTVDVLIPTCDRPGALAVTLTALFAQTCAPLRIVISDQGEKCRAQASKEVLAVRRLLTARGHVVELHRHEPRRGLAEHRDFLLGQSRAPYALFLDDDVVIESDLVERLLTAIREQGCGFVGSAVIGMSFAGDERPGQQEIEFWEGRVQPETVKPDSPEWERHHLHSAANLYHVQSRLGLDARRQRLYRVAWVGGCVMFDTAKLREAGGFEFWRELPVEHCGEDVYAQLRVMALHGGCGIIPSGAYHQELPTTVARREVDAPRVLSLEY
ncbi:MAG TPA: DUF4254 domain-containing protein [Aromatoleum sp.]|uniref:DUF4254 domain-containing protein n=1 Tax=Aromatoleum sp. TaxID=2307007 RepID=UPI002B47F4A7|nr:DUF4254 domain-containing protein [Aromatoleum sp.]HJV24688.1 DUF4254 domain-containing protein [Aromatoleum sp.]